jgi:putative aldouronate transport system permease protein
MVASTRTQVSRLPRSRSARREFIQYARQNWTLFLLGLPGVVLLFLFNYVPMFGTVVAFEDFRPRLGFLSPWVGLKNFRLLWGSSMLFRIVRNTILLNATFVVATTIFAVLVALLLNDVRSKLFKRVTQSLMFLPFFMGWTIVAMVLYGLIDYQAGTINGLLVRMGLERIVLTDKPALWPWILTAIRIWKDTGSGCIIYLAVLVGIDPQLYEAAAIDGANRWQRMRHVSLPALVPTVILLTLLAIGRIFFGDFGMIYAVVGDKAALYPTTDVIDTYILRALRTNMNYGMSAAVGLSQSLLGFICVFGSNRLARKYFDYSLF